MEEEERHLYSLQRKFSFSFRDKRKRQIERMVRMMSDTMTKLREKSFLRARKERNQTTRRRRREEAWRPNGTEFSIYYGDGRLSYSSYPSRGRISPRRSTILGTHISSPGCFRSIPFGRGIGPFWKADYFRKTTKRVKRTNNRLGCYGNKFSLHLSIYFATCVNRTPSLGEGARLIGKEERK